MQSVTGSPGVGAIKQGHRRMGNAARTTPWKDFPTTRTIYTYPYARDVRTNPTTVQYSQQQQLQQNKMKILLKKKQVPSPRSPTRKTTAWTATTTEKNQPSQERRKKTQNATQNVTTSCFMISHRSCVCVRNKKRLNVMKPGPTGPTNIPNPQT